MQQIHLSLSFSLMLAPSQLPFGPLQKSMAQPFPCSPTFLRCQYYIDSFCLTMSSCPRTCTSRISRPASGHAGLSLASCGYFPSPTKHQLNPIFSRKVPTSPLHLTHSPVRSEIIPYCRASNVFYQPCLSFADTLDAHSWTLKR